MIVHHHHHHHDDGDDGDDDELPLGISARSKLEDSVVFTGECDEVDHHCLTYKKKFSSVFRVRVGVSQSHIIFLANGVYW